MDRTVVFFLLTWVNIDLVLNPNGFSGASSSLLLILVVLIVTIAEFCGVNISKSSSSSIYCCVIVVLKVKMLFISTVAPSSLDLKKKIPKFTKRYKDKFAGRQIIVL